MAIYQDGNSYSDTNPGGTARLRDDLARLTRPGPAAPALPAQNNPTAITDGKGLGAPPSKSGDGIASPLTEEAYSTRTYYTTEASITTSDGLFTIKVKRLKHLEMKDANDRDVVLEFGEP